VVISAKERKKEILLFYHMKEAGNRKKGQYVNKTRRKAKRHVEKKTATNLKMPP